jgi:hypothetical protein
MILVQGVTDSGRLAQLVDSDDAADRLQAGLDAVTRKPIEWTRTEVNSTNLNSALAEATNKETTT